MLSRVLPVLMAGFLSLFLIYACEYENREELFPKDPSQLPGGSQCDTVDVSYSAVIQPIFNRSCAISGCHDDQGAQFSFGINLSSYEKTQETGISEEIIRAINHTGNFPMPKAAPKLPACEIAQIESWINNGRKNN
ncbi:MAG: hypothetical protein ACPF8V_00225 [Luteibaculum sp.]